MSEAWVCTELLYNSTPIGSERKRQLNPLLEGGGEGAAEGWTAWRDPGEGACMGREKKKKKKKKRGSSTEHVERGDAVKYGA